MTAKITQSEFLGIAKLLNNDLTLLQGKSVLVTGANGLIGSYLIDFLLFLNQTIEYNIKVYAMSRSKERLVKRFGEERSCLKYLEQDLNKAFVDDNEYDFIIHAASNAHPLAFSQDPVGTMKTNLLGTMNLLDKASQCNAKFLYLSTGEIYGNNVDHDFTEDDLGVVDTKQPRACYPESKRAAETLCVAYAQQYGVAVNVARLCYVYGATITDSNSRADAQFLRNALDGNDIVMKSEGSQKRTYCYVSDAVSALLVILLRGKSSEFYNIANPESIVSVREYAQTLADCAGVSLRFELPDAVEAKGYSKQADSILNSDKLQSLGWQGVYDIKTGLKNTITVKKDALCLNK